MRKSKIFSKIATFALAGVMAVSVLGTGNVAKAAEGDVAINATNFPDENFREFVRDFDSDSDGSLSVLERAIGTLDCSNKGIASLKGIEHFPYISTLDCSQNQLTELDLSDNKNLKTVYCNDNAITSLDFSCNEGLEKVECQNNSLKSINVLNNAGLKHLNCKYNYLSELDIQNSSKLNTLECSENMISTLEVGQCTKLTSLRCEQNSLSELDISKNLELTHLSCGENNLTKLDVTHNTKLEFLSCGCNLITELDLSKNTELSDVRIGINQISEIDLSNNTKLTHLMCNDNKIESLDLTNNKSLQVLYCQNNELTELDLSKNENLYFLNCSSNNITIINLGDTELSTFRYDEDKVQVIEKSVETITLNKTQASLEKGKTLQLTATVAPSDADLTDVTWSSSNTSVATVDANGLVTAKATGTATITAIAADMSGVTATCTVSVTSSDTGNTGNTGDTGNTGNAGNTGNTGNEQNTTDTKNYPAVNISYRTHIQTFGWEGDANDITTWKSNGTMSGTSGLAKRLEGINVVVDSADSKVDLDLGIQYTTHCQSYGWLPWSADGDMNGTEGEAKRLEAIMIQLTGADAKYYDVYYRVHAQTYGWLGWASNGAPAGTAGYAKRLEGIQIVVVKKGETFDKNMGKITFARDEAFIAQAGNSPIVNYPATSNTNPIVPGKDTPNVAYRTHVQSYGWQGWKYNGQMSGTSGEAKRLEGININLTNKNYSGGIVYTTHVQSYGWQGDEYDSSKWKSNGQMSGTSGEAKRLEAIKIKLTGEMAEHYDIYYRVHAQSYGWLAWASNGAPAGTAGYAKRLEGIQIILVKKGEAAPGKSYNGITSVRDQAYISKTIGSAKDLTFECGTNNSFELKTYLTHEKTGYYIKEIKGWTYCYNPSDASSYDELVKDGIHIRYCLNTEDQVNAIIDQEEEQDHIANLDYIVNGDKEVIIVVAYDYDDSDGEIKKSAYQYFKELADDKYLSIYVYDEQAGNALVGANNKTFLPLTENRFHSN